MVKTHDPEALAELINCLSSLESDTGAFYNSIADKIDLPLVKSLFQEIALDSQKHSVILKGVGESIAQPKADQKECEKKIGESWKIISKLQKEVSKMNKIGPKELPELSTKLAVLESTMGEEYYIFVELKTLHVLMKQINQIYNIDLGSSKKIFMKIINDEEHHRELLETIRHLITKPEEEKDKSLFVKYQNPDAWSRPLPSSS
jgi:rubrerythrin